MSNLYTYEVKQADGNMEQLENFKGKPLVIVNTASKCGLTPQFEGLQHLYEKYKDQGLEILGFPSGQFNDQEFHTQEETLEFCRKNYGVSFPVFSKIDVNGEFADPLFKYLTSWGTSEVSGEIKWNFTKFLIDRQGNIVQRYEPQVEPEQMEKDIQKIL
ncbi:MULTISPECIES: glutathione peroxidase [unclassified Planococcus (in: firmicutes)]|uniref:glutathione peroxidase n=1 Tax=Planococcus TaxID=1372 RepID=UPI000C337A98|nr:MULTISPECIES: glutathione peroxidase [unclassified Planococcus (in: firmicutes)]AUD12519.1 glutathione peroxidase [Planococcus sp. MB-3u-03]PKG44368.1 glutathione peroxidase [Planococcus sp. Urea-trap-24]PKG90869.1 glutathione peroxidase [Planococcus sp. Urea-3u-39]PKH38409.1 glutathione peroxidase [Planococcus sp. MB-3u-09]